MAVATDLGIEFDEVRYMKDFPDEGALRALIAKLEDPVENLVRKDSQFEKLGLDAADYVGNADAVVEVLLRYHRLLQRPIVVTDDRAIIGRPLDDIKGKDRVAELLS